MVPKFVILALISTGVAGCGARPIEPMTAERQNFRKQDLKIMFAKLISVHQNFGTKTLLGNDRYYKNAQVSVPSKSIYANNIICAKVHVSSVGIFGPATVDLHATTFETSSGTRLSMRRELDIVPACEGPYEPYPELEALSLKDPG
ncbi:hypothetical protein [Methylobacterium sp. E-045]|uniref:hypothetical protein n=1 Tax=Methylobacterium sp. E-045 TaxID=2836575 RepID=UPI001FB902FD|nr:hypothetical protein [Methylobacterium sp. E-045]MCJ2131517.1 hypothetical protein [Methylobacterium sp. E-045]